MELAIKNDDALIRMATIIQRSLQKSTSDDGFTITDEEKEQLLTEINKIHDKTQE